MAASAAAILLAASRASAQTWDGGSPNSDNWDASKNWVGDVAPVSNGTANVIMAGTVRTTPVANGGWDIQSLAFDSTAGTFTTTGGPLAIRAGGMTNNSSHAQTLNLTLDVTGSQTWNAASGPFFLNGVIASSGAASTLSVTGGFDVTISSQLTDGAGTQTLALSKNGSATLTLNGSATYSGATNVNAGKLELESNLTTSSSIAVAANALLHMDSLQTRVLRSPAISVSGSGKINLEDNKIITAAALGSLNGTTYTGITGLVQSGRNGSTLPLWDGGGIVTSQTAATGGNFTSIGVARASDVLPATATATGVWAGQTISGSDTLVMYTYGGDATLDGKINVDDYIKIDSGIAAGLTGWSNGDFNYDGKVNIDDYTQFIDANIGIQGAQFPTATRSGASVASVPEPVTSGVFLALPGFALTRRRRPRCGCLCHRLPGIGVRRVYCERFRTALA